MNQIFITHMFAYNVKLQIFDQQCIICYFLVGHKNIWNVNNKKARKNVLSSPAFSFSHCKGKNENWMIQILYFPSFRSVESILSVLLSLELTLRIPLTCHLVVMGPDQNFLTQVGSAIYGLGLNLENFP